MTRKYVPVDDRKSKQASVPNDLVRMSELTRLIPLSAALIRQRCDRGEIPHWRIGSARFFSVSEVLNALRVEVKSNTDDP